ncbi:uncharacterized protein LOC143063935 [Mytilus galloprovincialis]|uniref:uncharacterized protein LOC143063935 n=1 Tax=Mytilus galloprovincialis TaxID=29158 RepID=UPI003F7CA125
MQVRKMTLNGENQPGWEDLPEIVFEEIYSYLSPKQRHLASQVCSTWYAAFYSPRVWETFVLEKKSLTRRRFNFFKGIQRELCPRKTQMCLYQVGRYFKKMNIMPSIEYFNVYEFLRILQAFLSFYEDYPMPLLKTFHFIFACESFDISGRQIHGTGGKMLEGLKSLMEALRGVKYFTVNQLMLANDDLDGVLESVSKQCSQSIIRLEILDFSSSPYPLTAIVNCFENLQTLVLGPHNVDDEVVLLLAGTVLTELQLVQDRYTCDALPVSADAWRLVREMAPHLKVSLEISGRTKDELLIQPHAPVYKIVLATPTYRITDLLMTSVIYNYQSTLEIFAQKVFVRGSRAFHDRCDSSVLSLVRHCPKLHTLIVSERMSTMTVILLAEEGNLENLYVRRYALIKRADWPRCSNWTQEFYRGVKYCAWSYGRTRERIEKIYGKRWSFLRDKQFCAL